MAFPFLLHENFERGTAGAFAADTDALGIATTDPLGKLDFPDHNDDLDIIPWRGGYVMRIDLNRGTNDAFIQHNTAFSLTTGQIKYMRFFLRLGRGTRFPMNSYLDFVRLYSGAPPGLSEIALALVKTETWISLAIGSAEDVTHIAGLEIIPDVWTQIRMKVTFGNISTSNSRVQVQIGNNMVQNMRLNMQPLTHFRIGTMLQQADVRGTLYIDDVIVDTDVIQDQMYLDPANLTGESVLYIKDSYVFVGPGTIKGVTLIGGGADNTAALYDTDRIPFAHHDMRASLKVSKAESKDTLVETLMFKRGCYLVMTGTAPQVIIHYGEAQVDLTAAA